MKYTPKQYAQAFSSLVSEGDISENELVGNFMALIEKNGDISQRGKILRETDKLLRRVYGKRTVVLETARSVNGLKNKLKNILMNTDVVEEFVNPALVAGVRITVDDEDQFDGTLARKLRVLFKGV